MYTMRRPDLVTDFNQFAGLRADARAQTPEALRKTAQQFEALMTQQMLKSMRAASLGDDVMGGGQTEFYQDMFDQQMAVHLSSGRGLGVADLLVRQLQARQSTAGTVEPTQAGTLNPLPQRGGMVGVVNAADSAVTAAHGVAAQAKALTSGGAAAVQMNDRVAGSSASGSERASARPRSAAEFVAAVRPHAEAAAAELGVPARVLIAQAALETGWGRKAIKRDDGASSFNLFGIKADRRWNGPEVNRTTTEYANGVAQSEQAKFRTYASAGESFADYVRFIKSNPRYAEALRHGGDESRYVAGLQKAGYATDPAYAQKILRVAHSPTMNAALNALPDVNPAAPRQLSV
ncbi:MAG: flagellar assembly peptidoglycan hydrolase FlgJ [Pseudomonadota bacterium]|nr:flagellar assembly peptidoglycan hydrolase FlgJ [Pseudomonadota bacterium]